MSHFHPLRAAAGPEHRVALPGVLGLIDSGAQDSSCSQTAVLAILEPS